MFAVRRSFLVLLLLMALASPAVASPRDELLRFVPDDAGFCLVVQDLRGKSADVLGSPFAQGVGKTMLAAAVTNSPGWKQLREIEEYLKKHLGVGWAEIRDDLLGDAFVFCYRPGPPGKPEQEQGLVLLRAREAKPLAEVVRKLNALQKESGELKALTEREHKGVKYTRREEAKQNNFYLLRDKVLVFSGQEAMLQQAIERDRSLEKAADPPMTKRLRGLGLDKSFVALSIQPRVFDSAVAAKENDPGSKTIAQCWKALDGLGLGLNVGKDVELSLALEGRKGELPGPLQKFVKQANQSSELWSAFPSDALFAVAGKVDIAALYEFIGELMPRESKKHADAELERTFGAMLGKGILGEVLPALGPDWGVCVTAPPANGKEWTPRVLAAIRVARGDEDDPIDQAVFSGIESWAQLFVVNHNKQNPGQTLSLKTTHIDRVKARYLQGDKVFPVGVQPAFGVRHGYLVLTSSLAELRRFPGGTKATSASVPLARVWVRGIRDYLKDRREPLAEALAAREKLTKPAARARIDDLSKSLELIDRIELRQQTSGERVTFTLAVQPTKSLKR